MNITIGYYLFNTNKVIIKAPVEVVKETEKCYFANHCRFLKSEIGRPILQSVTTYTYIRLVMIDADEESLRNGLSKWFTDKANQIIF